MPDTGEHAWNHPGIARSWSDGDRPLSIASARRLRPQVANREALRQHNSHPRARRKERERDDHRHPGPQNVPLPHNLLRCDHSGYAIITAEAIIASGFSMTVTELPVSPHTDSPAMARLQAAAHEAERECVVGALVVDGHGRIFVQRRAPDRRLFPGCWDIVGGHVEGGETLETALAREIAEETGWTLKRLKLLLCCFDWETTGERGVRRRREFDFLVEIDGDLAAPTLEPGKVTEIRWLGPDELEVLRENRAADDCSVLPIVQRAFERLAADRSDRL